MPSTSEHAHDSPLATNIAESSAAAAAATLARQTAKGKKRLDVNPEFILAEGRNKRRRTPSPEPGAGHAVVKTEEKQVMTQAEALEAKVKARVDGDSMVKSIKAFKDKEGRVLSLMFIHLPDPKLYQDYYTQIKHPKSISQIEARLKLTPKSVTESPSKPGKKGRGSVEDGEEYAGYNDLAEVKHDLDVMFNNCKRYNVKEALIFQDARKLHKLAKDLFASFTVERESSPEVEVEADAEPEIELEEPEPDVPGESLVEDGIRPKKKRKVDAHESSAAADARAEVKTKKEAGKAMYKDIKGAMKLLDGVVGPEGTRAADFFDDLPNPKDWPDYYKLIERPISLTEITAKMKDRKYTSAIEWEADVKLMCANAKQYNMEESAVYSDAVVLETALIGIMSHFRPHPSVPDIKSPSKTHAIPKIKLSMGKKATTPLQASPAPPTPPPVEISKEPAMGTGPTPSGPAPPRAPSPPPKVSTPVIAPAPVVQIPRSPLPVNTVTDNIVRSLHRYSDDEKAAWVSTMQPSNVQEMKRLMAAGGSKAGRSPLALAAQPVLAPASSTVSQTIETAPASAPVLRIPSESPPRPHVDPVTIPKRPLPSVPLIRFFNFTFDVSGGANGSTIRKRTVKLRNSRGVVSHSIAVRPGTKLLEVTGFLEEGFFNLKPLRDGETDDNRLKDTPGHPPIAASIGYAPLTECEMAANGHPIPGGLLYPDDNLAERPYGTKWMIPFPPERGSLVLEVLVSKPAEPLKGLPGNRDVAVRETCMIFVARQT